MLFREKIVLALEGKNSPCSRGEKKVASGRFWLVELVGRKMAMGISNSFYAVIAPLLAPVPNFIQIGQKTRKLEIFTFDRFWLVGLVGLKMVAAT